MRYVYICGPITGMEDNNEPAFRDAFNELLKVSIFGYNPLRYTRPDMPWAECMKEVIPCLLESDGVALLPGWEQSRGCRLEVMIAGELGIECKALEEWL